MRGTDRGTILLRREASGTRRKKSENPENPEKFGNERNRQGNNFVTAGSIRNTSEKSRKIGNERNMKRSNCHGGTHPERVGKSRKNPEKFGNKRNRKGINFVTAGRIRNTSEEVGKIRKDLEKSGEVVKKLQQIRKSGKAGKTRK